MKTVMGVNVDLLGYYSCKPGEEDMNGTLMFKWWGVAAGSSTELRSTFIKAAALRLAFPPALMDDQFDSKSRELLQQFLQS